MNKTVKIKKIIALTIVCTAFSTLIPSTISIGSQCAYAYSDDELTSLNITSGVSAIPIYSSISHKYEYRIKSGEEIPVVIYSKISSDKTNIKLSTLETKAADVRVFVGKDNLKLTDIYSEIKIEKGEKKSIYIKLYDSKKATDDKYTTEYELIVERESSGQDETELEDDTSSTQEYDNIYLNDLILSNNDQRMDFNFNKTQSTYNLNVDKNVSYLKIKAVPEQDSYKLKINDKEIDNKGNNKYIDSLLLDKGKNSIKIRIISTDHERRDYYLTITKGKITSGTTETSTQTTTTNNISPQQNIQTSGGWQYKKADGTLAIGWTCLGNEWYYFDSTGTMKTGWLQVDSGKWYYLNESGVMVKDTVINGYKIGCDGVCIIK